MGRKNRLTRIIVLALAGALMLPQLHAAAEGRLESELTSITLRESPYSIGDGWTLDSTYSADVPYALVKGEQDYLAVGPYGTVMKSKNGINWRALSKFGNYHLTAVGWNGAQYIVFGAQADHTSKLSYKPSVAFVSTDGLHWEKLAFEPGEPIQQLIWGKNGYVAVGTKHVFTSKDGQQWSQTAELQDEFGWYGIKYIQGTYMIFEYGNQKIMTSKDGVQWTSKAMTASAGIRDLIWNKNQYLGVGNGIYTSMDGVSWKKQNGSPTGVNLTTLTYDGTTYLAAGSVEQSDGSTLTVSFTSKDGVQWKRTNLPNVQTDIYIMYPVKGGFAGIGSKNMQGYPDNTYALYTADGVQWSYRLAATTQFEELRGAATSGKRTVAVGMNGTVLYTDDGANWRGSVPFPYQKNLGRPHLFDVVWGGDKFVAVGNGGVYVSKDAVSWRAVKVPQQRQFFDLRDILWTGKFFVASSQVEGVYTSKDGLNWTKVRSMSTDWLRSMIWDGKRLIAAVRVHDFSDGVGYTKIMQTTNGTQWTLLQKIELDEALLAWNGKQYIAMNPYIGTKVLVSTDAKNWSKKATNLGQDDRPQYLSAQDGAFVAFNDAIAEKDGEYYNYNAYFTSEDGVTWREHPIPDKHPGLTVSGTKMVKDGVKAHGKYIYVGTLGQILYTNDLQLEEQIVIRSNGQPLSIPAELGKPYIAGGTTYVPLKVLGSALGYQVQWNPVSKTVTFSKDGASVSFTQVQTKDGRSYVPLRSISEQLKYQVKYERVNGEIVISID